MRLSSKILTSMLLMTAVSVGIAGAQDVSTTGSTTAGAMPHGALMKMHDLEGKINSLPDDVKAQLKAAKQAGDLEKVKSILLANGINMPKLDKKMGTRMNGLKQKIDSLSADVQAQLKAARDAKDFAQVKTILAASGITMPKLGKKIEEKHRRIDIKNLPADVRAELKAAFEAKDMAKVKSILAANGIGHKADETKSTAQ